MSNVYGVIHTEANREDNADAGDDVNSRVPVVEVAHHVSEGHGDHGHHSQAHSQVAQQQECDHHHTGQWEQDICPQLPTNDDVCSPETIHEVVADVVWRLRFPDHSVERCHCRNMLIWCY